MILSLKQEQKFKMKRIVCAKSGFMLKLLKKKTKMKTRKIPQKEWMEKLMAKQIKKKKKSTMLNQSIRKFFNKLKLVLSAGNPLLHSMK